MEVQEKIKALVTIFDHRAVEIILEVPKNVLGLRLLPSTLEKYSPDFFERCQAVTYSLLYLNFVNRIPEATKQKFFREFMPTQLGMQAFNETLTYVSERLKPAVTVEDLQALLQEPSKATES